MMKIELFSPSSQCIRQKVSTMFIGLIAFLVITSCSSSETSATSYLPSALEKAVRQEAAQFFTTTGFASLRLDTVTELTIRDVRHPTSDPNAPSSLVGKEMWCFTTVARGTVEGTSHEVSLQWFGFEEEEDWLLIPRHLVAYSWFWDYACDEAERLDS